MYITVKNNTDQAIRESTCQLLAKIVEQNNNQQALLNLEDKETTLALAYKKLSKKAAYKKKDVK